LKGYIFDQLKFELLTCGSPQAKYGFRDAPYHLYDAVISMDYLEEVDPYWESQITDRQNTQVIGFELRHKIGGLL